MRRLLSMIAAFASASALSSAQAVTLTVDDFNAPSVNMYDTVGGDAGIAAYADATRSIYHRMETAGANSTGLQSSVSIGGFSIPPGNIQMRNADTVTSTVFLNWTLPGLYVPAVGPVFYDFDVYASDAVTKHFAVSMGGIALDGFDINQINAPGYHLSIPIGAADQALLNSGGVLSMTITGDLGWDLSINEIGFVSRSVIPEPTSLALVGFALAGAGLASRRRKA